MKGFLFIFLSLAMIYLWELISVETTTLPSQPRPESSTKEMELVGFFFCCVCEIANT